MHRGKVQPLLDDLCRGLEPEDAAAALQGLLTSSADTRSAALAALPHVPYLASGEDQQHRIGHSPKKLSLPILKTSCLLGVKRCNSVKVKISLVNFKFIVIDC